jgi:hypothetical protein
MVGLALERKIGSKPTLKKKNMILSSPSQPKCLDRIELLRLFLFGYAVTIPYLSSI